ncbi:MAG: thymidine phosphorylase [Kiritimatiellae bacterium]|nr:thymidine phosphorylase [Kiritimatiellia bacterium]
MIPQWIIERKRDGHALSEEEIRFFINGFTLGEIPDYQMAAMAMAIYLKGMNPAEIAILTDTMMRSGDVIDTSAITKPKVDKHSTGGIGDKVSLILAPMVACCGVAIPMVSGRGLGITGGTLDKLEAVEGYRCDLSTEEFLRVVDACGCCITGQTGSLAPADKKLYALRDVTATVPSIALITASIMCKKMAEGIDSLVLDVKWGAGAFMKTVADARILANSMVSVGREMGKGVSALITDMNQPLGRCAGNALEIRETLQCLAGEPCDDLMEVTMALAERMLLLAKKAPDAPAARLMLQATLDSGEALAKFKEMMRLQGANVAMLDEPDRLPTAVLQKDFNALRGGFISGISADHIGRACLTMGAGRKRTDDTIDFAVGISNLAKIGDQVEPGQRLLTLHANDAFKLEDAEHLVAQAFTYADEPGARTPLVAEQMG